MPTATKANEDGCPHESTCCDDPKTHVIGCQHPDDINCACDDQWSWVCDNCDDVCRCEV